MKVKAKHWLNVDGNWYQAGDIFEVKSIAGFEQSVEVVATEPVVKPEKPKAEPKEEPTESTPKRRGRSTSKA